METLQQAIERHKNNHLTIPEISREIEERATGYIKDGLFNHHLSFYYLENGYFYYIEFFGLGWNKRKISRDHWVKYQNALAYNVQTGELCNRREIKGAA